MSTRKTTLIYSLPIAVASLAVGMVLASRLDLTPSSAAQIGALVRRFALARPDIRLQLVLEGHHVFRNEGGDLRAGGGR